MLCWCRLFVLVSISCGVFGFPDDGWEGNWFPHGPNEEDTNPKAQLPSTRNHLYDAHHGVVMGVADPSCDDAKTNLTIDWWDQPENYTCVEERHIYLPNYNVRPKLSSQHIPAEYSAPHRCMDEAIPYDVTIPTFGTHRPLWAKFGEYKFVPRQRWIHNLEHGSVVMLYHPCANPAEVKLLKSLVKSCLYRYVITPYNLLSSTRPLALVTWGYRLEMSKVAPDIIIDFIKEHALKGPEQTSRDGQYDHFLIEHAEVVPNSDINDVNLCPSSGLQM